MRDVVSFANSAGGHIIFGIAASNGTPTQFAPISEVKIDDAKLRLENIIRTSIEPTIQGLKIISVTVDGGCALIIEIPRGLFGLHMIKNRRAFIARTSAGKFDLDVNEIRAAFVGAEAAVQRLNEFRGDRMARILSGDIPWSLSGNRILTIHLLPLISFSQGYSCVIDKVPKEAQDLLYRPGPHSNFFTSKFTFDGYAKLFIGDTPNWVGSYSQLFRNGAIEHAHANFFEPDESPGLHGFTL